MYKTLGFIMLLLVSACTEDKKMEQIIIPEVQLEALQKAKNLEKQILEAQQNKITEQGL